MMIWATAEAKARGYAVDEEALGEVVRFTFHDPVASKVLPAPPKPDETRGPEPPASLPTAYAALSAAASPGVDLSPEIAAARLRLRAYLVENQSADGGWAHGGGRPPMLESREIATLMTLLALAPTDSSDAVEAESRRKALAWLDQLPEPGGLQARVLRLLVRVLGGGEGESLRSDIEAILREQRADGGWGQAAELPSDAFITGQALYALSVAGLGPDRPEIGRARAFLVGSQTDEGSWPMHSRPAEVGGGPAKDLQPLTFAASAWATLGLLRSSPE